jgi:hypothetical protein
LHFLTKNSAILLQGSAIFGEARKNKAEDFTNRVIVTMGGSWIYEGVSEPEFNLFTASLLVGRMSREKNAENQFF